VLVLGLLASCQQPQTLSLSTTTAIVMKDGKLAYLPPTQRFARPQDWSRQEAVLEVKLPATTLVASLRVKDSQGRSQSTRWTEGQPNQHNLNYDSQSGTLRLHLRPTLAAVDEQGHTDEGFDPSQIQSVQLLISPNGQRGFAAGKVEIRSQQLRPLDSALEPAQVRPLYGENQGPPGPLKSGVSRYFVYGDLHRWSETRPLVEKAFAEQQQAGLHAFRNMGGLDLRARGLGPEVFPAMREYLELAEKYGQDQHIFTLLDGAIPNPTLQRAFQDPQAAQQLVEELRPFIREFGRATLGGKPVIFDLVNEIHGTPGAESAKQALVEQLVETFIQEAPGAKLTVGVQNFRELKYWNYLFEKYQDRPVSFAMTFHVYEPMSNLPHRNQLNLPDNIEVGITEADPNVGMAEQVAQARAKGYDWMLFWQDASHPYSPSQHRQVDR
jgi:hypothetical protein